MLTRAVTDELHEGCMSELMK